MSTRLIYGPQVRPARVPPMPATTDKCGTYAGYQQHYKDGTKPCRPCMHAQTVYVGQWRARNGHTKNALVPYELLGLLLAGAPTHLEELVEARLGDAVVTRAVEAAERHRNGET